MPDQNLTALTLLAEVERLREREAKRKAVIDEALTAEVERLRETVEHVSRGECTKSKHGEWCYHCVAKKALEGGVGDA